MKNKAKNTAALTHALAGCATCGYGDYGSLVSVPGLSGFGEGLMSLTEARVKGSDLLLGALLGGAGAVGVRMLVEKFMPNLISGGLKPYALPLGAAVVGVAAYAYEGKDPQTAERGAGHALGAIGAGLALLALDLAVKSFTPVSDAMLADLVDVRLGDVYVNEQPQISDMYVDEKPHLPMSSYSDNPGLADAMQVAMGEDDDESMADVMMAASL